MILYLQKYIHKILSNEKITKAVNGVYFQVPSNNAFPYIYIGEFDVQDISTKAQIIEEISFAVSIYTRDKSLKAMLELAEEIKKILSIKSDKRIVLIKGVEDRLLPENDGVTHQFNMKFKAIIC